MEEGKEEKPEESETSERQEERADGEPEWDGVFAEIKTALAEDRIYDAQMKLDKIEERGAEWHYWQAQVCKKKNWNLEGYRHLKEAVRLDPENERYQKELEELDAQTQTDDAEEKKKRKKRKKNMGGNSGWNDACGECCVEGCCVCFGEAICEGICEGC